MRDFNFVSELYNYFQLTQLKMLEWGNGSVLIFEDISNKQKMYLSQEGQYFKIYLYIQRTIFFIIKTGIKQVDKAHSPWWRANA